MEAKVQRDIFKSFKSRGLSLRADASKALLRVLLQEEDIQSSLTMILTEIKDRVEKKDIKSSVIDLSTIESIVADLSSTDEDISKTSIQLFDAFEYPRIEFDEKKKSYILNKSPKYVFGAPPESKPRMFRERLVWIQQRLLRTKVVKMKGMGSRTTSEKDEGIELSTVDSLLGITESRYLCGYLVDPVEDEVHLEDLTGTVQLSIPSTVAGIKDGLYTLGSIVIVLGAMQGNLFVVSQISQPPAESRETTLEAMNIIDVFGNDTREQQMVHMQEMEAKSHDTMFVILSDMMLDRPLNMEKLETVFQGYEQCGVDPLFIMIGSFTSMYYLEDGNREAIKDVFDNLANVICSCPRLSKQAKFVFVPSEFDPGIGTVFPRHGISDLFVKGLKKVSHVSFASNPCRIRYYTQEIVIYRENLLQKMHRTSIVSSYNILQAAGMSSSSDESEPDPCELAAKTILNQGHLSPLPLLKRPIAWELDFTMRLMPVPHLVVLADHCQQYNYHYQGCNVANPGSFSSDYSFLAYRPSNRTVEFCSL